MSLIKFKNRFTKEIIFKTVKLPSMHSRFKSLLYFLIFDFGIHFVTLVSVIFFVVSGEIIVLPMVMILVTISLFQIYLQTKKYNDIKLKKYVIQVNKIHPLRRIEFTGVNYEQNPYLVYSQPYENFESIRDPIKLIFFSDLHLCSDYYRDNQKKLHKIADLINNADTDIVIFGGDLLSTKFDKNAFKFFGFLKKKYLLGVYGNHDALYLERKYLYKFPEEFIYKMEESGVKMLVNDNVQILLKDDRRVTIAGISDLYSCNFDINMAFRGSEDDPIRILVSHNPEIIDFIEPEDRISLVLSGHTHWGQIRISSVLNLYKFSKYPKLIGGLYQLECGTKVHISQGLGNSTFRTKFNVDNSIDLIELYE